MCLHFVHTTRCSCRLDGLGKLSSSHFFSQPFDMASELSRDQLELIYLQSDIDFRKIYNSNDLVTFNKNYVYGKHPNLEQHARKLTSLFGSTYCCEQYSRMKLTKDRYRCQLKDEHLVSDQSACHHISQNIIKC